MKMTQIYDLTNKIVKEHLGDTVVLNEDLSNLVDIGEAFENLQDGYDHYVRALYDHIGKVVFVDRIYQPRAKSVMMDGWEFGAVLEKVYARLPEAQENESWELQDGAVVDQQIFYKPSVEARFYNKRTTFEIPMSFTTKQIKSAFSNATQMNSFMSMIETAISNAITERLDALISRTVNNMIAETVNAEYGAEGYDTKSTVKAVNLLYLYNDAHSGEELTAEEAITNPDFIKFASYMMKKYIKKLSVYSTLFNIEGESRFTPADKLHVILLSDFADASDIYLQSSTFHNSLTELPNADTVPFWQGSGKEFGFNSVSAIDVKTTSGATVSLTGVIGVMFDRDALGVSNLDRRVTSFYNAKGEFYNEYHKVDAGYFNSLSENMVVFFLA